MMAADTPEVSSAQVSPPALMRASGPGSPSPMHGEGGGGSGSTHTAPPPPSYRAPWPAPTTTPHAAPYGVACGATQHAPASMVDGGMAAHDGHGWPSSGAGVAAPSGGGAANPVGVRSPRPGMGLEHGSGEAGRAVGDAMEPPHSTCPGSPPPGQGHPPSSSLGPGPCPGEAEDASSPVPVYYTPGSSTPHASALSLSSAAGAVPPPPHTQHHYQQPAVVGGVGMYGPPVPSPSPPPPGELAFGTQGMCSGGMWWVPQIRGELVQGAMPYDGLWWVPFVPPPDAAHLGGVTGVPADASQAPVYVATPHGGPGPGGPGPEVDVGCGGFGGFSTTHGTGVDVSGASAAPAGVTVDGGGPVAPPGAAAAPSPCVVMSAAARAYHPVSTSPPAPVDAAGVSAPPPPAVPATATSAAPPAPPPAQAASGRTVVPEDDTTRRPTVPGGGVAPQGPAHVPPGPAGPHAAPAPAGGAPPVGASTGGPAPGAPPIVVPGVGSFTGGSFENLGDLGGFPRLRPEEAPASLREEGHIVLRAEVGKAAQGPTGPEGPAALPHGSTARRDRVRDFLQALIAHIVQALGDDAVVGARSGRPQHRGRMVKDRADPAYTHEIVVDTTPPASIGFCTALMRDGFTHTLPQGQRWHFQITEQREGPGGYQTVSFYSIPTPLWRAGLPQALFDRCGYPGVVQEVYAPADEATGLPQVGTIHAVVRLPPGERLQRLPLGGDGHASFALSTFQAPIRAWVPGPIRPQGVPPQSRVPSGGSEAATPRGATAGGRPGGSTGGHARAGALQGTRGTPAGRRAPAPAPATGARAGHARSGPPPVRQARGTAPVVDADGFTLVTRGGRPPRTHRGAEAGDTPTAALPQRDRQPQRARGGGGSSPARRGGRPAPPTLRDFMAVLGDTGASDAGTDHPSPRSGDGPAPPGGAAAGPPESAASDAGVAPTRGGSRGGREGRGRARGGTRTPSPAPTSAAATPGSPTAGPPPEPATPIGRTQEAARGSAAPAEPAAPAAPAAPAPTPHDRADTPPTPARDDPVASDTSDIGGGGGAPTIAPDDSGGFGSTVHGDGTDDGGGGEGVVESPTLDSPPPAPPHGSVAVALAAITESSGAQGGGDAPTAPAAGESPPQVPPLALDPDQSLPDADTGGLPTQRRQSPRLLAAAASTQARDPWWAGTPADGGPGGGEPPPLDASEGPVGSQSSEREVVGSAEMDTIMHDQGRRPREDSDEDEHRGRRPAKAPARADRTRPDPDRGPGGPSSSCQ